MEKIVEQALLYDFYGELLTDNQKSIYEDAVLNDFSLSEIAQEKGISRQGVHDTIKRCNKILEEYEDKLHLLEKFLSAKNRVQKMHELISDYKTGRNEKFSEKVLENQKVLENEKVLENLLDRLEEISREIIEDL